MKDFDLTEIRAARTMGEANYILDKGKEGPGRPVVYSRYREKIKATYNKLFMRKGEEEFV